MSLIIFKMEEEEEEEYVGFIDRQVTFVRL